MGQRTRCVGRRLTAALTCALGTLALALPDRCSQRSAAPPACLPSLSPFWNPRSVLLGQGGKKYDVITSIEKVKTGLMSYLNPMAYMYPMDEMKLCFNYDDEAEAVSPSDTYLP